MKQSSKWGDKLSIDHKWEMWELIEESEQSTHQSSELHAYPSYEEIEGNYKGYHR